MQDLLLPGTQLVHSSFPRDPEYPTAEHRVTLHPPLPRHLGITRENRSEEPDKSYNSKTLKCSQACLRSSYDMFPPSWVAFMVCGRKRQLKEIPEDDFVWKSFPVPGRRSPVSSAHSEFCAFPQRWGAGNQPGCCEEPILCEIHRIWDTIQLFSRKGHILAIHKTHKKPNHKYFHVCLL